MGLVLVIAAGIAGVLAILTGLTALQAGEVKFSPKKILRGREARIAGVVALVAGLLILSAAGGFGYFARHQL